MKGRCPATHDTSDMKTLTHIILVTTLLCTLCVQARNIKVMKGGADVTDTSAPREELLIPGTFMVGNECEDCNRGYTLGQVTYSGYDKTAGSNRESFFITNGTDRMLAGVSLYIDYLSMDSVQMHRRFVHIPTSIPSGETRRVDIRSWDRQKTLYYHLSPRPRKKATPYDVSFIPIAIYLKY